MQESPETRRSPETLDRNLEQLILSCQRVGEGGKAVVLKLSILEVPKELQSALERIGVSPSDQNDKAVKLFKLHLPNKGAREYRMHMRAHEALQGVPTKDQALYAKIPTLSSSQEITFDPIARKEFERRFDTLIPAEKTQLITMEYVEGEDLATVFYKWILEKEAVYTPAQIDAMDFKKLYEEVAILLQLESIPEENIHDPRALELGMWKTTANNTNKLYRYLQKNKFPLSSQIVAQVENTIRLCHQVHITHGDMFERNIMVEGGAQRLRGEKPNPHDQAFVIDFGEAREGEIEGVDDFSVIRRLKTLLMHSENETDPETHRISSELHSKAKLLKAKTKWNQMHAIISEGIQHNIDQGLTMAWNRTAGQGESYIDDFFIMMQTFIEDGSLAKEKLSKFADAKKQMATSPYQKNRIDACMKWILNK